MKIRLPEKLIDMPSFKWFANRRKTKELNPSFLTRTSPQIQPSSGKLISTPPIKTIKLKNKVCWEKLETILPGIKKAEAENIGSSGWS